jgi:lipopolysaccharide transport system ATP-binding protein
MGVVIQVQAVGKKYLLSHKKLERYATLREALYSSFREWGRRLWRSSVGNGVPDPAREDFWALRDVSFEVNEGDRIGIIGRNGAGKSTLLKILSRITEPTEGRVRLRGRVGSLLEVGTGFHPELTGRENIYLNGAILGMRRHEIRKKFDTIVEFAEVEKFLDTPVKRYSSGMYVRLAFAVAAHMEPEILVVDEVLAVGDTQFQKKCLGKMQDVGREGRTVLFVSHNMGAVSHLCNGAILLESGRIRRIGPVSAVVEEYLQSGAVNESLVDLAGFENRYGNGELEILSLELVNAVGRRFAVHWDEPIDLRIRYKMNERISGAAFGIGCQTVDSVPLFTVRSPEEIEGSLTFEKSAAGVVAVRIYHNLRAGRYNLHLGVASGNYSYYYNHCAAQIEVLDVGTKRMYPHNNPGIIHCDAEWSIP